MTYPVPEFENLTSIFLYANSATNALFAPLLLLAMFIIFMMVSKGSLTGRLVIASFFCTIFSIMFMGIGLISHYSIVIIFIVMTIVFTLMKKIGE